MRVRSVLVATWLVFAGLATAAGFAAVSLVGQELDVRPSPVAAPSDVGSAEPSASTSPGTTGAEPTATDGPTRSTRPPVPTTAPPGTATSATARSRSASRVVRGNYVSATCRGASVTLSASPAPGWRLDDYRPGPAREARARFRSDSGEVEFRVSCAGGRPAFDVEEDRDSGGGDD